MPAMNKGPGIFEDIAKLAGSAASTLAGFRDEVETLVRQQLERLLAEMKVTPREEFEAVRDMAAKARAEQEKLEKRVAALEAELGVKPAGQSAKKARRKS